MWPIAKRSSVWPIVKGNVASRGNHPHLAPPMEGSSHIPSCVPLKLMAKAFKTIFRKIGFPKHAGTNIE